MSAEKNLLGYSTLFLCAFHSTHKNHADNSKTVVYRCDGQPANKNFLTQQSTRIKIRWFAKSNFRFSLLDRNTDKLVSKFSHKPDLRSIKQTRGSIPSSRKEIISNNMECNDNELVWSEDRSNFLNFCCLRVFQFKSLGIFAKKFVLHF